MTGRLSRPLVARLLCAGVLLAVAGALAATAVARPAGPLHTACPAATVHYTAYPGVASGLERLPWVAGAAAEQRVVGLLWYWPRAWRAQHVRAARIYTRGEGPGEASMKILWVFPSPTAKRAFAGGDLTVRGERLDGPGRTRQHFASVSYAGQHGAPSFASIVSLPTPGCWRLHLAAGRLRASVVVRAVSG